MRSKISLVQKLMKGVLTAIQNSSKNIAGTSVEVTSKQYDEIEKNNEFYTEVFSKSNFEKLTGFKVTRINCLCKNVPLLGTKVMVWFERVTEKSDVDVTESVAST